MDPGPKRAPVGVIWHARCLYFDVLGSLGRSWDDPGTLGSTKKDALKSMLRFYRYLADFGFTAPVLKALWVPSDQAKTFHIYFQVVFSSDFWVWIWVSGIGKPSIWQGRYCKNQLLQKLDFSWFQGQFVMSLGGRGSNFHGLCCPGEWLEIWWLFRVILRSSQILRPSLVGGKWPVPGP